jgi:UDPglucose 6-dehydrogenase
MHFKGNLIGKHFALWGLAFKPNTDDIREAPALTIIEALTSLGATITAYDPEAMVNAKTQIGNKIKFANNQYQALHNADALVIATEWNEFRNPDFDKIKNILNENLIFDGRNLYTDTIHNFKDFTYYSIGVPSIFN